jgi:hypothetical protein
VHNNGNHDLVGVLEKEGHGRSRTNFRQIILLIWSNISREELMILPTIRKNGHKVRTY